MNFLHALVFIFTLFLLFMRQKFAVAATIPSTKRRNINYEYLAEHGDSPITTVLHSTEECMICARTNNFPCTMLSQPKCKRDPDIQIDNEDIGVRPVE